MPTIPLPDNTLIIIAASDEYMPAACYEPDVPSFPKLPHYKEPAIVPTNRVRYLAGRDRNKPCPCGSGKKSKNCCEGKESKP